MIKEKFEVCLSHIDTQINHYISNNKDVDWIINELQIKIIKFQSILKNISEDQPRYHFIKTHNDVCLKRIEDFNLFKSKEMDIRKMFKLIKFRDRFTMTF